MCYTRQTVKKGSFTKSQKKEGLKMNDLIMRTKKQIEKLRKAVSVESKYGVGVDDKYSDFVVYIIVSLRNYLTTIQSYQKMGISGSIYGCNTEFFAKMNDYIESYEFYPLTKTSEFKGIFEGFRRPNTPDMVVSFIEANFDKILKFSALSNEILRSNEIFADEKLYHYRRSGKVKAKLSDLDTSSLSSLNVVASYRDGGFDKLCPKELEEKKRCDIARQNKLIKSQKKLSLGRFFHGLF